jgi:DNA-binding NtrC family response regulator
MSTNTFPAPPARPFAFRKPTYGSASRAAQLLDVEMVGSGVAMRRLRTQLQRIGPYYRNLLLTGETGCGKETAARMLHAFSPCADGPFVSCNAAVATDALLQKQGGARLTPICGDDTDCLLSAAQGGTLYLAGICEMTLEAQAELLRVLQRSEWARRGAGRGRIETRIIASTSRDLRALVAAGRFRQELYCRVAMLEIGVPSLRERGEDIPELAGHFLKRFAVQYGRVIERLSEDALERLRGHRWPGNLREFENVIRGAVVRCEGDAIEAGDLAALGETWGTPARALPAGMAKLQEVVERHVLQVLQECGGNKVRAAEVLGISRSTLYRMIDACAGPGPAQGEGDQA